MPTRPHLLVGFLLLALPGCGAIQITTSTSGDGAGSGRGSDGSAPEQSSALGGAVAKAYAGWSYTSCAANEWCHVKFAGAAGVRPDGQAGGALANPKASTENPDPEWLPGWDKLREDERGADDVWNALALAGSNRTWAAACKKKYAEVKPTLDKREKDAAEAIAAAQAKGDVYERLGALVGLPSRAKASPPATGAFGEGADAAAYASELALIEGFKKEGLVFVLEKEGLLPSAAAREALAPRWDAADEELAFCVRASEKGYDDLAPLPPPHSPYTDNVVALVKPVFSDAEKKKVADAKAARRAAAEAALKAADTSPPKRLEQLAYDTRFTVKLFKLDDKGGATVKLHEHHDYNKGGDNCRNGFGVRVPCPVSNIQVDQDVSLVFARWPAGVKLETGDSISLFADVDKHSVDAKGLHEADTLEGKGLFLRSIKKKGGAETRWFK